MSANLITLDCAYIIGHPRISRHVRDLRDSIYYLKSDLKDIKLCTSRNCVIHFNCDDDINYAELYRLKHGDVLVTTVLANTVKTIEDHLLVMVKQLKDLGYELPPEDQAIDKGDQ